MSAHPKDRAIEAARDANIVVVEGRVTVATFNGDGASDPAAEPLEVVVSPPNTMTTVGGNLLVSLLTGVSGTAPLSDRCYLAVGDSPTAAAANQTDLQAVSNKVRRAVSGAPAVSGVSVSWQAVFGTSDANFVWQEAALFTGPGGGAAMFNRLTASFGAKDSSKSRLLTMTVTVA